MKLRTKTEGSSRRYTRVSGIGGMTSGDNDPIFNTRTLDATVELRDGQSFSVAGLLQNDTTLAQNQLPWLGDVPILGSLFKSSSYQKHDTELVVIVDVNVIGEPAARAKCSATGATDVPDDPERLPVR